MMFGKIICFFGFAWAPVNEEASLACSILDPIEYHVHCCGFFLEVELTMLRQRSCQFLLVLEVVDGRALQVWRIVLLWFVHYERAKLGFCI